jgi:DNA polymerase-3 subunit alpha
LDALGQHRAALMMALPGAIDTAEQTSQDLDAGQADMFGISAPATVKPESLDVAEWSDEQRLIGERDTLGLYLSGHPFNCFREELKQLAPSSISDLKPTTDRSVWVAGLIVAIRTLNTQRGKKMAFVTIDDNTGRIEISLSGEMLNTERHLIHKDNVVAIHGQVSVDDYSGGFQMRAEKIFDIDGLRSQLMSQLIIEVGEKQLQKDSISDLADMLQPFTDVSCEVVLSYRRQNGQSANIVLGSNWRVKPAAKLMNLIESRFGADNIKLIYDLHRMRESNESASTPERQYLEAM